ncbi:MAG: hypothetical protein NUV34_08550 [Sulfuricaulis sp.]|nr:hypothetical protein [Sulfuricaulis sp.]
MLPYIAPPPPMFDHVPETNPAVVYVSQDRIDFFCGKPKPGWRIYACTVNSGKGAYAVDSIYILMTLPATVQVAALRHEYGHVNGWRH